MLQGINLAFLQMIKKKRDVEKQMEGVSGQKEQRVYAASSNWNSLAPLYQQPVKGVQSTSPWTQPFLTCRSNLISHSRRWSPPRPYSLTHHPGGPAGSTLTAYLALESGLLLLPCSALLNSYRKSHSLLPNPND